jgi:hypothetical protein
MSEQEVLARFQQIRTVLNAKISKLATLDAGPLRVCVTAAPEVSVLRGTAALELPRTPTLHTSAVV